MKVQSNSLLEEISENFTQFLENGKIINISSFFNKSYPNSNISNFTKLLKMHFLLTKTNNEIVGVVDFIKTLRKRIKKLNTARTSHVNIYRGKIKGRININKTLKERIRHHPMGKTVFACDEIIKNYDIPENLVLKKLLYIIYNIVFFELKYYFDNNYSWLDDWTKNKKLKRNLEHIYTKNVYVKRFSLIESVLSDKIIKKAKNSRNKLYSEAGSLLLRYNRLMKYELYKKEVNELFRSTFITPNRIETLFEFYWIMKILKQVQTQERYKNLEFEIIYRNVHLIAKWHCSKYKYLLYHDSIGNFILSEDFQELFQDFRDENNFIGRELKAIKRFRDLTKTNHNSIWNIRPDIIIEKYDRSNNLKLIMIGVVKYTDYKAYAISSLRDLVEYMALIRSKKDGKYLQNFDTQVKDSPKVIGVLFTDNIKDLQIENRYEDIKIVKYGRTEDFFNLIDDLEFSNRGVREERQKMQI